jgi:hypothetical protein
LEAEEAERVRLEAERSAAADELRALLIAEDTQREAALPDQPDYTSAVSLEVLQVCVERARALTLILTLVLTRI